jgi:O-antigen ligase
MLNIVKYFAFFFLINNLIYCLPGFYQIAEFIFLALMSSSLVFILFSSKILKEVILNKSFFLFFFLNLINLVYYVLIEFGDIESFKYLSARFIQFSIFSISIFILREEFPIKLISFLKYLTVGSLILSIVFNFPNLESRYMGIFFNPNEFSIVMVVGFALVLFTGQKSFLNYFLLLLFLFVIILSGSRSAIVGLLIALSIYLFHYRTKNIISILFILIGTIIFSSFGGENNAIQRMFDVDLFLNRKYEYLYALDTFLQKPIFGHGLKNYAYIDFSLIQFDDVQIDFGAHNGYLSILVQYGFIFSILFFSTLIYYLNKVWRKKNDFFGEDVMRTNFFIFILIYTLVNGMFENTLIGINFFQSNLFWITLSYLLFYIYNKNESNSISD